MINSKQKPNSATIVFVHGNSSSSSAFDCVTKLEDFPYRTLALDLPGHGSTSRNAQYSIPDYCDFIKKQLQNISGEILLVGNSLGGHLIIEIAEQIPNLKGLVIFGTPPLKLPLNFEEAFLPTPLLDTYFTDNPTEDELNKTLNAAAQNKSAISTLKDDFLRSDPKVRSALALSIGSPGSLKDEASIFCNLNVEKHILHGLQDPTVNLKYLHRLRIEASIPFEITEIDNCGHFCSLEQPAQFIKHITAIANSCFKPKAHV